MATTTSIPRFLLPQRGQIWRRVPATLTTPSGPGGGRVLLRFASSSTPKPAAASTPKKPIVLEKPERFNPPSHGSRLPKKTNPRHYGGDLGEAELAKQKLAQYPGVMAPAGTFEYRFWHKPWLHTAISLTALTALAAWTFSENFKRTSPYYDMVPTWSEWFRHPITCTRQIADVIRLNSAYEAAIVQEKRQRKIDDVEKRTAYRKAHGMPEEMGFWPNSKMNEPTPKTEDDASPVAVAAASDSGEDGGVPAGTAR